MPAQPSLHSRPGPPASSGRRLATILGLCAWLLPAPARADTALARCEVQPHDRRLPLLILPCTFSQRQGYIGIQRSDEVRHDLEPRDAPGRYLDERKRSVLRQAGLGKRGLVFRFPDQTLKVFWQQPFDPARPAAPRMPVIEAPFRQALSLHGIGFAVSSDNVPDASGRVTVEIRPGGLAVDNAPLLRAIEGRITGMELADLDADGSPELYLYAVNSRGEGRLLAFSANRRRSLSDISLPPLEAAGTGARGWRGHDEFAVVETSLVRRFPVYRRDDPDDSPSGGWRQFQYKLARGEASWQLRLDRVVGY